MKWIDDVKGALEELGGKAHLSKIYPLVEGRRKQRNDSIGQLKAWVRYTLQQNSRGKGYDIFFPVQIGSGIWRLKQDTPRSVV